LRGHVWRSMCRHRPGRRCGRGALDAGFSSWTTLGLCPGGGLGRCQRQRLGLADGSVGGHSPPVVLAACGRAGVGRFAVVARSPTAVAGRRRAKLWRQVRAWGGRYGQGTPIIIGTLWSLMPCGLLYSALMVAALTGNIAEGAGTMALFALGSSVSLWAGPWLLLRLKTWGRQLGHSHCRLGLGRDFSLGFVDGPDARSGALVCYAACGTVILTCRVNGRLRHSDPCTACKPPAHTKCWRTRV